MLAREVRLFTFVSQSEATHLRELLECFQADQSGDHLETHDCDLVLFDESRPNPTLLSRLLIHQTDQSLNKHNNRLLLGVAPEVNQGILGFSFFSPKKCSNISAIYPDLSSTLGPLTTTDKKERISGCVPSDRQQTKSAKVMFSQVSVYPRGRGVALSTGGSLSGEGEVSVGGGSLSREVSVGGGLCHRDPPPMYSNERAVRILLECILVFTLMDTSSALVSRSYDYSP